MPNTQTGRRIITRRNIFGSLLFGYVSFHLSLTLLQLLRQLGILLYKNLCIYMILKSVVPTVSSLRGYYYTYLLKFSYPYILHILVRCSSKSILSSVDIGVSGIEGIECLFGKKYPRGVRPVGAGDSWRSPLLNLWQKAYPYPPREDSLALCPHQPPLGNLVQESGCWRHVR